MNEITSVEQYHEVIMNENAIILFTANWCPDCMVIKPFMPSIVEKYNQYNFYTINRDQLMDLCVELEIFGIPSFVALKVDKKLGASLIKNVKHVNKLKNSLNH